VRSKEVKEEGVEGIGGKRCAFWLALLRGTVQGPALVANLLPASCEARA
jgi:hypothetical protein